MTPQLALTLSFDGIGLTQRTAEGWQSVGHVPLDAPDLPERLAALRETARTLCPDGIATSIVLPDEQILNRHLPGVVESPAKVAAALDGLTPYAVTDLVFDWKPHPDGGIVVAAVARETIDEALSFARQYGFNPVALTARPAPGLPFAAEPDFGTGSVEPAVVVPDAEPTGATTAEAAAPDEAALQVPVDGAMAAAPQADTAAQDTGAETPPERPDGDGFTTRRARSRGPVQPDGMAADAAGAMPPLLLEPSTDAVMSGAADAVAEGSAADPVARLAALPARLTVLDAGEALTDIGAPFPSGEPLAQSASETDGAAAGQDPVVVPLASAEPIMVADPAPAVTDPAPERPTEAPVPMAGTTDRATTTRLVAATRKGAPPGARTGPAGRPVGPGRRGSVGKLGSAGTAPRAVKPAGGAPYLRSGADTAAARLAEPSLAARSAGASMTVRPLGDPALAGGSRALPSVPVVVGLVAALLLALAAAVGLSRVVIGWLAPPTDVAAISADAPMVAAVPATDATPGTPAEPVRPASADPSSAEAAPSDAAPPDAVPSDAGAVPASSDVALAPLPEVPTDASPGPEIAGQAGAVTLPQPDGSSPVPVVTADAPTGQPDTGTTPGPAVAVDVAGGATTPIPGPAGDDVARPMPDSLTAPQAAPPRLAAPIGGDALPAIPAEFVLGPGPAPAEDPARPVPVLLPAQAPVVLVAFDPAVALQDPLALVLPARQGAIDLPEVQPVPPPGVSFRLDDRGLVVATPEGAISPDGHRVTLGRPAIVPPARPLTASPSPAIASDPATIQRLARLRPPPRPQVAAALPVTEGAANLPPATPAPVSDAQDTAIGAAVTAALSAARTPDASTIRPLPRPASLGAPPAPADADPTDATFASATARAIPVSLRPASRPAGLDAIAAAAAVRIAPLPPAADAAPRDVQPQSAPQQDFDYDDGEPEVASVAPRIPSSASVARQATVENALNMRELNLIGVYGTASDRRALVRLPTGRFVKVEIGDSVDGGQVADIGDRDLRYVKGGRSIVLSMPRG